MTIDKREAAHLLAGLNGEFSAVVIHHLTEAQWWTLAAFISQWVDPNQDSDIFSASLLLAGLSRAETVAAIIVLLATRQLEVEFSVTDQMLAQQTLPPGASFELGFAAIDTEPQCTAEEAEGIRVLVASKLEMIEIAVARVAPDTEVH